MLFSSFITLGLATAVLAGSHKQADSITVEISGPTSVNSIDDLKLTATVKNTGAETVKLLKYSSILDNKRPNQSFIVTKDGANVPFTGVKTFIALKDLDDSAFATIPAGGDLTVQHEVASSFNFASAGPGKYTFEPIAAFQVADNSVDNGVSIKPTKVQAITNKVEVMVTGDIIKRGYQRERRSTNICTDPDKKAFLDAAYAEGKALATGAINYLNAGSPASIAAYNAYFGANPVADIIATLNSIANENDSDMTLGCTDPDNECGDPKTVAYTVLLINRDNIILGSETYFCPRFFRDLVPSTSLCNGIPLDPPRLRGGMVLHELTHALQVTNLNIATETYGCAESMALSDADSVVNADNYNCLVTQAYYDTHCR